MPLVDPPHVPTPAELEAERAEMIDSFMDKVDAIDAARGAQPEPGGGDEDHARHTVTGSLRR